MKLITVLVFVFLLQSCSSYAQRNRKPYKFNGRVAVCGRVDVSECGLTLVDCEDGYSYQCLTNVKANND